MYRWQTIRYLVIFSLGLWLLATPLASANNTEDLPPNTRGLSGGSR